MDTALRRLPAVHRLLAEPRLAFYADSLGVAAVKTAISALLDDFRRGGAETIDTPPPYDAIVERIAMHLALEETQGLIPVLNGTGVLLHTNLGRAPLAPQAIAAMSAIGGGYSNLEYDVESGSRGSRYDRVATLLRETTGAQDGIVVNNCAAALLLVLDTFARAREVIVSRNELIEIGGGFRLPDVLAQSTATLVEVGTTNRVYLHDFERALSVETALLLRTHASNFRIEGFVAEVAPAELAALGGRTGVPVFEDLGTGTLTDLRAFGLKHERTIREAIVDGADMVAFSGDKLLGGPQAGIIVGRTAAIARLRANPLLRALRVDKATLAALGATLRLYTTPGGIAHIPLYAMLGTPVEALFARAHALCAALRETAASVAPIATTGYVGGGTLPQTQFASAGIGVEPHDRDPEALAVRLRRGRPPFVARIREHAVLVDLRTINADDDERVVRAFKHALAA